MKRRFLASLVGALVLVVGVSAAPTAAHALTTHEACPNAASNTRATVNPPEPLSTYDPALFTGSTNTALVNCASPFKPPLVNIGTVANPVMRQSPSDLELWFAPVPAAAFVGNTFTLRVVGTCEMQGFVVSMVVDKNVAHNGRAELIPLVSTATPYIFIGGCSSTETTKNTSVTVTDTQKAQIQQGDFALLVTAVGGGIQNDIQEQVTSVSIPYSMINVSYDANGGNGTISTQNTGLQTTLATNTFTNTGHTFSGWNTAANGSGTPYADAAMATFSNDTTLFAQWTSNTISAPTSSSGGGGGSGVVATNNNSSERLANTGFDLMGSVLGASGLLLLGLLALTTRSVVRAARARRTN